MTITVRTAADTFTYAWDTWHRERERSFAALRAHEPGSLHLATDHGVRAYPPSQCWVFPGTFRPYEEPRTVTAGVVVAGLEHHTAVGEIELTLARTVFRLVAFSRGTAGLHVHFTDATSGFTTYPGGRSLVVDPPAHDGSVEIDFNRAANLACSFTNCAPYSLAPAGNSLPVAVEAGEMNPRCVAPK